VKELLLEVADLSPAERAAYLDDACKDDTELRVHVTELLTYLDNAPDMFKTGGALNELIEKSTSPEWRTTVMAANLAFAAPALPGKIGRYPILERIGSGGMGIVYRAHDPELERDIAIKTLPASFAADRDRLVRFRREAKMLATVDHPGVTTIHSIEESDHGLFLTMEYVPGQTLGERIRIAPLEIDQMLRLSRQVAAAMEASHEKGVVHRDLKPDNVKVTPDDRVKVLDFGLARSVAATTDTANAGEVVGTPGYMSPEQLRGQESDHRTDIWAFGCLLYTCLVGHSPFRGRTQAEVFTATLTQEPALDALPTGTPRRLRELVAGCLSKSVESRVHAMTRVRREIDELIAESRMGTEAPIGESPETPNNLRRRLTSLIGRENELAEVLALLRDHPLVTLTGAGGCGKTRLALEVGWSELSRFSDGVWFVEFAPLSDPELVPTTVMATLGLKEETGRSPTDVIVAYARTRKLLLVLDNCEHLVDAVGRLAEELLEACPTVRLLATTREALGIDGERVFPVLALTTPRKVEDGSGMSRTSGRVRPSASSWSVRERSGRPWS
jgi:non-specific serine/threonine protein kinase